MISKRRRIPGTDLDVFPLGLGGNVFGFTADTQTTFALLDRYVDAGGNHIDTADSYCHWAGDGGESETLIGAWTSSRRNRDSLVIATKVGQLPGEDNLRPDTIRRGVEGSLRRLQTDVIDLYYAHQDHGDPLEDTLQTLDDLVREGKVRHIAASNYSAPRLEHALALSREHGWAGFVALQPQYNLVQRHDFEDALAAVCVEQQLGVIPWWGLASGYLTGKYRIDGPPVDSVRVPYVEGFMTPSGEAVLDALEAVAVHQQAAVPAVALAWLLARPGVVSALASARTTHQLADLLQVVDVHLDAVDVERLDAVSTPAGVRA